MNFSFKVNSQKKEKVEKIILLIIWIIIGVIQIGRYQNRQASAYADDWP